MRKAYVAGQHGYFFTKDEYTNLCEKILANNELIKQLKEDVGLNEK